MENIRKWLEAGEEKFGEGAGQKIGAGGIKALCKRKAYADDPKCKALR